MEYVNRFLTVHHAKLLLQRMIFVVLSMFLATMSITSVNVASVQASEGKYYDCYAMDYRCVSGTGYAGQGSWGYPGPHNCTLYAAYRLAQNGYSNPAGLGDAYSWDEQAQARGVVVDKNPAVGSIAQRDVSPGHVMYVEEVNSDHIVITEDNWEEGTGRARIYRGTPYWNSLDFVHFWDIGASGSGNLLQIEGKNGGWSAYNITAMTSVRTKGAPGVLWTVTGPMVFAVGEDGALKQFNLVNGSWRTFNITGPNGLAGGVEVVHAGSAIEVFARSTDGRLLQIENKGSGWAVYDISAQTGARIKGAPSLFWTASGPNVFAAGKDGALKQFTISGGAWRVGNITGRNALAGGVDVVHTGSAIEVFATSTGGNLLQIENKGRGWAVYNITAAAGQVHVKGAPGVLWGSSGPKIFVSDTNGRLRQFSINGGSWIAYPLTGPDALSGGVDVVKAGSAVEVFATSF